jgi:high affinity choline transporter 7
MRGSTVVFVIITALIAIFVKSIYGLFYLCSDLVYVILFPQLVSVIYIPWVNVIGSAAGKLYN